MYAIASLLDPLSDQTVRSLWAFFERSCGLTGVRTTPLPHFSWQGADAYVIDPVEDTLAHIAEQCAPFVVRTAGLGIFTGKMPVVYIPLVKDEHLLNMHKMVWEAVRPYAIVPNVYYDPAHWVPHITLALREVDPSRLGCAVEEIASKPIELEIMVDNLSLIFQSNGQAGIKNRFTFKENITLRGIQGFL